MELQKTSPQPTEEPAELQEASPPLTEETVDLLELLANGSTLEPRTPGLSKRREKLCGRREEKIFALHAAEVSTPPAEGEGTPLTYDSSDEGEDPMSVLGNLIPNGE